MIRYLAWRDEHAEGFQERPSLTVFERDVEPVRTGILDANGTPIYRVEDRAPLGFDMTSKPRIRVRAVMR